MPNNGIPSPVVVCVLDGWGYSENETDNAITKANTPNYDRFWASAPRAMLKTSGSAVGLPDGQMGNSEVGHMNLGGGRVVLQDLPRIDDAIKTGALNENPLLQLTCEKLKADSKTLHILGLLSPGGVHSHQDHIIALAKLADAAGVSVAVHAFLDGRDTPPKSAAQYIADVDIQLKGLKNAYIATVAGRYYAMDRDQRWDRVQQAYNCLMGQSEYHAADANKAVEKAYTSNVTDEFVHPTRIAGFDGIKDGDAVLMANFRADRAREILTALFDPAFDQFDRPAIPKYAAKIGMVSYSNDLDHFMDVLFPPVTVKDSLGEVVSDAGLRQLRIAETEKYAHVTFFFNGGDEAVFEGEDRILIPSPDVATYDLKPEMSAHEVTEQLENAIRAGDHQLIVVNYANPDMVGHTGVMEAAIKAVETIDQCLGKLEKALVNIGGVMLLTADHGNVEMMRDHETGQPHTAHTTFDVPILMINADILPRSKSGLKNGRLADVAPTVLSLMDIDQPGSMTGNSLLIAAD